MLGGHLRCPKHALPRRILLETPRRGSISPLNPSRRKAALLPAKVHYCTPVSKYYWAKTATRLSKTPDFYCTRSTKHREWPENLANNSRIIFPLEFALLQEDFFSTNSGAEAGFGGFESSLTDYQVCSVSSAAGDYIARMKLSSGIACRKSRKSTLENSLSPQNDCCQSPHGSQRVSKATQSQQRPFGNDGVQRGGEIQSKQRGRRQNTRESRRMGPLWSLQRRPRLEFAQLLLQNPCFMTQNDTFHRTYKKIPVRC